MKLLGLEIKRVEDESPMVQVPCFHCARIITMRKENVRTVNYCSSC
jgi:hypothetical protein